MVESLFKVGGNGGAGTMEVKDTAGVASIELDGTPIAGATQGGAVADAAAATALDAPAGGTGATAGAYDDATNRDLMIASQNAIIDDVADIRTQFNALLASLEAAGVIAT